MYVASDIAEFALQFVGIKSPYEVAADSEEFSRALDHFNLLLAEKTGTRNYWWWSPATQEIELEDDVTTYDMNVELGSGAPLMMVYDAFIRDDATGKRTRIKLLRRWEFEERYRPENSRDTLPCAVYIDRSTSPQAIVLPTPVGTGKTLLLVGIEYPEDVTEDGGDVEIKFGDAWARYFALETACDIGMGPVVSLPPSRHDRLLKRAAQAERRLNAFNNRENVQGPRYTKPRNF